MDEYISKEMAIKKLQMQLLNLEADQDKGEYSELCENRGARDALDEAICDIRTIKAADVQPVKHGKWKRVAGMNSKCSVCSHYFPVTEFDSRPFDINYCPNCGARMDIIYEDDKVRAIKVTGWGNYCDECDAKMDGDKE